MEQHHIAIDAKDADIKSMSLYWHGNDDPVIFIRQSENGGHENAIMFGRDAIPQIIEALQQAYGE